MPFKSQAQRAWGHTPSGVKALGGKVAVAEWDAATPAKLPRKLGEMVKLGGSTSSVRRTAPSAATVASAPKVRGGHSHPIANLGKFAHPRGRR